MEKGETLECDNTTRSKLLKITQINVTHISIFLAHEENVKLLVTISHLATNITISQPNK